MLDQLPPYLSWSFGLITLLTAFLFYWVVRNSQLQELRQVSFYILLISFIWLNIQASLAIRGVYNTHLEALPPKIVIFGILPMIIIGTTCFLTDAGRRFIDSLPLIHMTYLHMVRIPVELALYGLFLHQAIPELMTFNGRNFDIVAGLTAPLVAYFGIKKGKISNNVLLAWNYLCLTLLINIVVCALLSAPSPLQQFGFTQPNVAVLNFPFCWLPTFVVPIVLFCHIVSIRQLHQQKNNNQ